MLAASRLPEEVHGGGMWFPGQEKLWWATDPASAVASGRAEQLARAREEMLGLLADLPESEHELSFSDLIVVTDQDKTSGDVVDTEVASAAGGDGQPAADHDQHDRPDAEASTMEVKNFDLGVSKRRRSSRSGGGGGASRSEQPVLLKQNRIGSGRRVGGEGVLLNLYMPCSLTRSLTTGSSSSRSSTRERAAACTATVSEEAQTAKWGCWPSIWASKAKQQNKKGNPSSTAEGKGKSDSHKNKKKKVQSDRRASTGALV